jgi:G protein beta subunit-like protein
MLSGVFLITASLDKSIKFWEPNINARCYRVVKNTDSQVNCMKITKDRKLVAAAGNPNINVFETDTRNRSPVISFQGHTENVTEIGYNATGTWMYSASEDKTVKIWDMRLRGAQTEFKLGFEVNTIALHPNQIELICGCQDGNIRVVNLMSPNQPISANKPRRLRREMNIVRSLTVSPDGSTVVSIGREGSAFVWSINNENASSIKFTKKLDPNPHKMHITKCLYSNNGEYLATASADAKIKIWNGRTFEKITTLKGHEKWIWDIRFSIDSKYLLSGSSDFSAILWDIKGGASVRRFGGNTKSIVNAVEFNDDVPTIEDDTDDDYDSKVKFIEKTK